MNWVMECAVGLELCYGLIRKFVSHMKNLEDITVLHFFTPILVSEVIAKMYWIHFSFLITGIYKISF